MEKTKIKEKQKQNLNKYIYIYIYIYIYSLPNSSPEHAHLVKMKRLILETFIDN